MKKNEITYNLEAFLADDFAAFIETVDDSERLQEALVALTKNNTKMHEKEIPFVAEKMFACIVKNFHELQNFLEEDAGIIINKFSEISSGVVRETLENVIRRLKNTSLIEGKTCEVEDEISCRIKNCLLEASGTKNEMPFLYVIENATQNCLRRGAFEGHHSFLKELSA